MKIYTGTGDRGKTSLFSGERIPKSNDRIEAYGEVDELNSVIGALIAAMGDTNPRMVKELQQIQSDLFAIGAWLATTPDSAAAASLRPLTNDPVERLECAVDRMEAGLDRLSPFILPGGHRTAAWAHIARTVCRRAERRLAALQPGDPNHEHALVFLNRLSDYFFVMARHCNKIHKVADKLWTPS